MASLAISLLISRYPNPSAPTVPHPTSRQLHVKTSISDISSFLSSQSSEFGMEQTTTHTVNGVFSESAIDADKTPEQLRDSLLAIESPSDSEEGEDVHSVYEIGSDQDEGLERGDIGVRYRLRSKRRWPVDSLSEEDDDHTSSPPKRRRATIIQKHGHVRDRPVKVFVPSEIWLKIFSFSQPMFLARARGVSRTFKTLIDDEKVWKCARIHHFPEYPDPVLSLNEWEMWNLYLGIGCMICHAPKTKKRYWRFRIRCCVDCLKRNTIKEYLLKERPGFRPQWIQYLIYGGLDSWGNWTTPPTGPRTYFQKTFWLNDVKVLEMRMKHQQVATKILKAEALQAQKDIEMIEGFEAKLSKEKGKGADLVCRQRYIDIREKCLRLDPPFTDDVLCHIPAYQSAIRISRPLTDRSWKILLNKLEAGREAAEVRVVEVKRMKKEAELASAGYKASAPMKSWIGHFLAQNGGAVERGCEASFALQALNYARTRWFAKGEKHVPLSTVQLLWDEKLNNVLNKPGRIFICAFCDKKFGLDAVFSHITMTHPQDMGWAEVSGDTPSNYWRNQEWPAELPILPFGGIFEGVRGSDARASKPKQVPSGFGQVLPISNIPGPRAFVAIKLVPGHKALREFHQAQMNEILSKIQTFRSVPDSHRFFLWFRLSIASYLREYNQIPNLTIFALAADIIQQQRKEPLLRSLLRCGVCGVYQSNKRKPFIWLTLSNHFNTHSSARDQPWPEKLLMLPSKADIFGSCSKIPNQSAKKQWVGMMKEVDKELGDMLDDTMQMEEEKVRFKDIPRQEGCKGVIVQEKEAHRPNVLWRPIKPQPEEDRRVSLENFGTEVDKVQGLKRTREIESLRDQKLECGQEIDGWDDMKEREKEEAGNLQHNIKIQGDRVSNRGDASVRMKLLNQSRESEPLQDPKRGLEPESGGVEHEEKRLKVGNVSPVLGCANIASYKNMPVPEFSSIPPWEIIEISRTLGNPVRPIEIPATIQVTTLEAQVLVKPPDEFNKPQERPEVYQIKERSLSPSVDVDIEELFADA